MNEPEQDEDVEGTKGRRCPRPGRNKNNYHNYKNHPATVSVSYCIGTKGDCHATPPPKELSPLVVCIAYHSLRRRHSSTREPRPVPRRGSNRLLTVESSPIAASCLPLRPV